MFQSTLLSILAVATGAYAQFAISITKPVNNEFVFLGESHDVTIHAVNIPAFPASVFALTTELSGCTRRHGFTKRPAHPVPVDQWPVAAVQWLVR